MAEKKERFCALCRCDGHSDMPRSGDKNWDCPLLKAKICAVCCEIELAGGLGAPDTFRKVAEKTGKSPQEIHSTCVACPHGGKDVGQTTLVAARDEKGELAKTGPAFRKAKKEAEEMQDRHLRWLRGDLPKSVIRRINVQRGFKP